MYGVRWLDTALDVLDSSAAEKPSKGSKAVSSHRTPYIQKRISIAEDQVERDAVVHQVLPVGHRELKRGAGLDALRELVAGAEGQRHEVVAIDVTRPEVRQVAALEVEVSRPAVVGVMRPVQLHQRVDLVQVGDVVVQVQVA